jgi:hypothetical protein
VVTYRVTVLKGDDAYQEYAWASDVTGMAVEIQGTGEWYQGYEGPITVRIVALDAAEEILAEGEIHFLGKDM